MPFSLSILLGTEIIEKDWYNTWWSPGFLWVMLGFTVVLAIIAVGWTVERRYLAKRRGGGPKKKDPKNAVKGNEDEGGGDDAPPNED